MTCHPTRGHVWPETGPRCYCGAATWGVRPVRVVVHAGPDTLGRYSFATYVQVDAAEPEIQRSVSVPRPRRERGQQHFGSLPRRRPVTGWRLGGDCDRCERLRVTR